MSATKWSACSSPACTGIRQQIQASFFESTRIDQTDNASLSQVDIETSPSKVGGPVNLAMGVRPLARFLQWKSKPCGFLLVLRREFAWKSPDILQCWEGPVRCFVWSIFLFPLSSISSNKFVVSPGHDTKAPASPPPSTLRCAVSCASVCRFPLLILIITGFFRVLKPLLVSFHCHSKINVV
jgi:hypothetical protein